MTFLEEYINDIKTGKIIACKKIKKFYIDIIEPIVEGQSELYYFDPKPGEFFVDFVENFCTQSKGQWHGKNMQLMLFQKAKYQALLGIKRKDNGERRFREVFDVRARKNGKSQENAVFAEFMLLFNKGIEVYVSATTHAQALRIWEETRKSIEANKFVSPFFKSKVFPYNEITNIKNGSQFKVLSGNTEAQDGLNISVAIIDEVHQLSREVYDLLIQGTSAQKEPILSMITTSGFVREGLFDDKYSYAKQVLDGVIDDPTFMPLIYEQDSADEMYNPGLWIKSNPALNFIKDPEFLEIELEKIKGDRNALNSVKVKDFNIIGVDNSSWLDFDVFNNETVYNLDDFNNTIVIGGLDLSRTGDMTAFTTLVFDKTNHKVIAETMYWVTQKFLDSAVMHNSKVPFNSWINRGLMRVSGEDLIDYHDITKYIVDNFKNRGWSYARINYDSYSANYLIQELESIGFAKNYCLIPTHQGAKTLSIPMQTLEAHLRNKTLSYQNNPITKWCFSNVELEQDRNGNMLPKKKKDQRNRKIDGVATILNAYVSLCENLDYFLN